MLFMGLVFRRRIQKMKKSYYKENIIFILVYCFAVLCAYILELPCIWRYLTGFPCPGCGITRALFAALNLDFRLALSYNFMFWSVPLLVLAVVMNGRIFKNRFLNRALFVFIGTGFFINWIIKLIQTANAL